MGFITEPIKQIVGGVTGALSGKGPAGLDPANVNAGAFIDPNLEANKKILEQQRAAQLQRSQVANQAQTGVQTGQNQLINTLQAQVAGTGGPSVAELQMNRGLEQNRASLVSQAASNRGVSSGLNARNLVRAQAGVNQQAVADTGMLRAQEQQAATGQLAGLLGQTRTQDLASQQQADTLALQYMQLGLSADQAQFLAQQELEKVKTGQATSQAEVGAKQQAAIIGAGGQAAAALLSDETQKTNIEGGEKDVASFLKSLSSKKYDYKDTSLSGTAEGKRYGIIAQDLEKSDMGKSLVKDTPHGKMVDVNQSVGALLAAVSHLNKRLEKAGA